jgi:hypothetical protein
VRGRDGDPPCCDVRRHRAWSTIIAAADLFAVESHFDLALRHLESAHAIATPLLDAAETGAFERHELNDAAAEAGVLIEQLTRLIAGSSLDEGLGRLVHTVD